MKDSFRPYLSIDRIDVNGNYCPENCRWTDWKTQHRNRTNNRKLEINGDAMLVCEWEEKYNLPTGTIKTRERQGWIGDRLITPSIEKTRNVEINGITMRLFEWSKKTGIPANTIRSRIRYGWSGSDLIKSIDASKR